MSESSSTEAAPRHEMTPDNGWCLEKESWGFHRSAFRVLSHPLEFGEYGHLRRQISSGKAELLRFGDQGGLYRVKLRDGTVLDILARATKGKRPWYRLLRAMLPTGKRRSAAPSAPVTPPLVPPAVVEVPAPPPLPTPVRRPSTLTLGAAAPSAAEVLASRMRPKPPPPRLEHAPVQKPARAQGRR